MTRVRQIWVDGACVHITELHVEIAKLIYARRPFSWGGGEDEPAPWDQCPARVQIEFLELAHAVMAHPRLAPCQ